MSGEAGLPHLGSFALNSGDDTDFPLKREGCATAATDEALMQMMRTMIYSNGSHTVVYVQYVWRLSFKLNWFNGSSRAVVGKCIYVNSNPGPQQTPTVCGKLCRNSLTGLYALLN